MEKKNPTKSFQLFDRYGEKKSADEPVMMI